MFVKFGLLSFKYSFKILFFIFSLLLLVLFDLDKYSLILLNTLRNFIWIYHGVEFMYLHAIRLIIHCQLNKPMY